MYTVYIFIWPDFSDTSSQCLIQCCCFTDKMWQQRGGSFYFLLHLYQADICDLSVVGWILSHPFMCVCVQLCRVPVCRSLPGRGHLVFLHRAQSGSGRSVHTCTGINRQTKSQPLLCFSSLDHWGFLLYVVIKRWVYTLPIKGWRQELAFPIMNKCCLNLQVW